MELRESLLGGLFIQKRVKPSDLQEVAAVADNKAKSSHPVIFVEMCEQIPSIRSHHLLQM